MRITIICVGRLKEKYWSLAAEEYVKRLGKYCKIEIIEVADEKAPETLSLAQEQIVKKKEGERIIKQIKPDSFVITLEISGKMLDSVSFASFLNDSMTNGISHITFIIGGSLGLSKQVLNQSNMALSFSKMTFPHQLMRVILLEQVYRGFRIIYQQPYHK